MPKYTKQDIADYISNNCTFFEVYNFFTASNGLKLRPIESYIFCAIYNFTVKQDRECYLSINQFVELTGTTKKTVIKAIQSLESRKLIKVDRGFTDDWRQKNWYTIDYDTVGSYMFGDSVETTQGVETTPTEKNVTTPCQKLHGDSVETTQGVCRNYTGDSVEITQGVCRNYTGDSVETTPNNIINNHNNKKENNHMYNHSEYGGFAASADKSASVSETKNDFSFEVQEIEKVYPRKLDDYSRLTLEQSLKELLSVYSLEDLTTAAANYSKQAQSEPLAMRMMVASFFGRDNHGQWRFMPYLPKK